MKIVHCFYTMEMGGAQVLAIDLMNRMCTNHEISLVVVNNQVSKALIQKIDKRVAVHLINRNEGSRNPWPLIKANLLLRWLGADIIHFHEPNIGRIIKFHGSKTLYTIHDVGIPTTYYNHFDVLVAISDAVQQDVASRYDRPIKKVYNGINAAPFRKRTQYVTNGGVLKIVQLSRLMHEKKGQDILLEALSRVKHQYGYTNFHIDFVGAGPSRSYLEELSARLGLSGEVTFAGEQNRDWLYEQLASYHLMVQPSRYEGFGLTILEGFAAGLPVLASDIEGPAEIIRRTPRGFVFANEDVQQCGEMLHQIFQQYESGSMEALMKQTMPITDHEYSIEACVSGYLKEYEQLIQ